MKIKLGVVVGGVAAVAVLAFGLTQLNLGKGGQGRISLREDVSVRDTSEREADVKARYVPESVPESDYDYVPESVPDFGPDSEFVSEPDSVDALVTTVTAKSKGSVISTGEFNLAVCAPSDLAKINLTYMSIGGASGGQVYNDASYDYPKEYYVPNYTLVNDTTPAKQIEISNGDTNLLSKNQYSISCVGGVEWVVQVPNAKSNGGSSGDAVWFPYFTGNVQVGIDAFDANGGKLGDMVIVEQDVPKPVNAVLK